MTKELTHDVCFDCLEPDDRAEFVDVLTFDCDLITFCDRCGIRIAMEADDMSDDQKLWSSR